MDRRGYRISRRQHLRIGLGLVAASLLTACGQTAPAAPQATAAPPKPTTAPAAPAQPAVPAAAPAATTAPAGSSAFNHKRFNGEKIEVLLTTNPTSELIKKRIGEFQEMTGITANLEIVPEQQQRQKQVIEFTSGNPSFDVTDVSWHVQKRLFAKGKWLQPLNDMLKDPTLTFPDFDFADISKAAVEYATQADGAMDTLPQSIDYWILYLNKELFDSKGLKEPKTYAEMIAAAKALHDPSKNQFGFVARGLKNANVPVWSGFMQGWDIDPVKDGNLQTTSPEAIEAAKMYQDLLKNYAPAGVSGFNWNESQSLFFQGNAAIWYDGIGFTAPVEDKTKSKVAGKTLYALQPAGPKAQHSAIFGGGLGISANSKKAGPSYFFIQWATGKSLSKERLQIGAGAPSRASPYQDPETLSKLTVPRQWVDVVLESSKIGRKGLPEIIPVTEFRDIFGIALTNMISGADPKSELERATAEFQPILEKSEKG